MIPSLGIAWSTFFRWRGLTWLPRLVYSYRAPMLFASFMAEHAAVQGVVLGGDERLRATEFDGSFDRRAEHLSILYLSAHGRLESGQFELLLYADAWRPASSGLDGDGPRVAVFDACDLVDPSDPAWSQVWTAHHRPHLRMVLGFASLATVNRAAAFRGEEFAERLVRGEPVASAWIAAVRSHSAHGRDRPAAIAFGADDAEARRLVERADLQTLMGLPPLTGPATVRLRH